MPYGTNPVDTAKLQGRLWTPQAELASLASWWDFGDLASVTISTAGGYNGYDSVLDKSGKGQTLTVSGSRPGQAIIYSRPMASFGAGLGLVSPAINLPQPFCIFQVIVYYGGGGTFQSSLQATQTIYIRPVHSGVHIMAVNGGSLTLPSPATNQMYVNSYAFRSGSIDQGGINGAIPTIGAAGPDATNAASNWYIGNDNGNTASFNGAIGETIIATKDMGRGDPLHDKITGYLAWKWGVPLAGGHRFTNRPPLIGD